MEKVFLEKLEERKAEYLENQKNLQEESIISNPKKFAECSKKIKFLEKSFTFYNKYLSIIQENKDVIELIGSSNDEKFISELKQQKISNDAELVTIENELIEELKEKDPKDSMDIIFEIKGAVGGAEANIFAGDLFWMYQKYCQKNNFSVNVIASEQAEQGGYTYIMFEVTGEMPFGRFKYESGVHRVQRVPATESKGRVHTSTVTVLVMPKATEVEVTINPSDLEIDTFKSGGAGGQHVNKTESGVRITHKPTGIIVSSQDGRSQHSNKDKAMELLRAKIFEQEIANSQEELNSLKKLHVGSRERSDKIRTYNYPDNRVTDHRINTTWNKLDRIIEGAALGEVLDSIASWRE